MTANFVAAILLQTGAVCLLQGRWFWGGWVLQMAAALLIYNAQKAGARWRIPSRWRWALGAMLLCIVLGGGFYLLLRRLGGGSAEASGKGTRASALEATSLGVFLRPKLTEIRLAPPTPRRFAFQKREEAIRERELIPFRGLYWIFQPPFPMPPPSSPIHEGAPNLFRFRSTDTTPIRLSADQSFDASYSIASARGLEFVLELAEEEDPSFDVLLLLRDTTSLPNRILRFDREVPQKFDQGYRVRFARPPSSGLQKFNRMTLEFRPEMHRVHIAPRIAVRGFRFY